MTESRPELTASLTGAELRRWYWLRSELAGFARRLGVSTAGGKVELTDRIAAALDGDRPPPPIARPRSLDQVQLPLTGSTLLPRGQRCTQQLRAWFVDQVGPGFRFDATMRSFVAQGGHTLDEAAEHWRTSRAENAARPIDAQFELNRFARAWHADHPGSSHAEMLSAWQDYRSRPRDRA